MNQVIIVLQKTKQSVDRNARTGAHATCPPGRYTATVQQQTNLNALQRRQPARPRRHRHRQRRLDIAELPLRHQVKCRPAEDYVHRIGREVARRRGRRGDFLMRRIEQKMFESIKKCGNKLLIRRIEGFEPQWWGTGRRKTGQNARTETTQPLQIRQRLNAKNTDQNHTL